MNIADFFLDFLFPFFCVGCRAPREDTVPLCPSCLDAIALADARMRIARLPFFAAAATRYDDPRVRALIRLLKFKSVPSASVPLAALLIRYAEAARLSERFPDAAVAPIPLHARRARMRGFNQAELIAAPFAEHFGLPLMPQLLTRTRHTPPQSALRAVEERSKNLTNCFAVRDDCVPPPAVIVIDDVLTSGATFAEARRALLAGGVARVLPLAVAIA